MDIPEVRLKRRLARYSGTGGYHPWIFSGALANEPKDCHPGCVVKVIDDGGEFVCYGHYNPHSSIRVRMLTYSEDNLPDKEFIHAGISRAFEARKRLRISSDAFRVVFSESDGLPGLIVDKFGDYAVLQTSTAGMDSWKHETAGMLLEICEVRGVVERNDSHIRKLEGMPCTSGMLAGEEPPKGMLVEENKLKFEVDLLVGQKTGFYLDQRDNRAELAKFAMPGMEMLDAFCFSGGFALNCLRAGAAHALLLDESGESLETAQKNLSLNDIKPDAAEMLQGDAFSLLRKLRDEGRQFDMVVLDPPKFAPTRKDADKAERGYKDINVLGMKLLRPGGILATFSCSSGMPRERFREILRKSARDCGRDAAILATLGQPPDHPVRLAFPESEYLKGFICEIRNP